jgi:hypothetical protein
MGHPHTTTTAREAWGPGKCRTTRRRRSIPSCAGNYIFHIGGPLVLKGSPLCFVTPSNKTELALCLRHGIRCLSMLTTRRFRIWNEVFCSRQMRQILPLLKRAGVRLKRVAVYKQSAGISWCRGGSTSENRARRSCTHASRQAKLKVSHSANIG